MTHQNQSDRSIEQRLNEYRQREREIQRKEAQLVQTKNDHRIQTQLDFGVSDGDILSIGNLAELILKLNDSNKGENNE